MVFVTQVFIYVLRFVTKIDDKLSRLEGDSLGGDRHKTAPSLPITRYSRAYSCAKGASFGRMEAGRSDMMLSVLGAEEADAGGRGVQPAFSYCLSYLLSGKVEKMNKAGPPRVRGQEIVLL